MPRKNERSIPADRARGFHFNQCGWLVLVLMLAGASVQGDLVLTNYTASRPLKIMPIGDSITDDCSINGAWRLYLQPLLQTNGYNFTNVGRWVSMATATFTKTHHEGICGAVIAFPGTFGYHGYPTQSNYAVNTVSDALINTTPDLFLIDLGVNDMGRGRDPYLAATNHMAALLDLIFEKVPSAQIIVGKPTSITHSSIETPVYSTYGTNMPIFCAALQSLVNTRRAQGQNVFLADLFSAVNPASMLQGDGTHPNAVGFSAMAQEWLFRIAAMTLRTDQVVTPFISGGSSWKYSDQGLDLGTNWAQPQFDDSAWAQGLGRLGYNTPGLTTTVSYGPAATNKFITTYFRRTFDVPAHWHYTNLNFRLNQADGAVVWLNGKELFRVNLPGGPLSFQDQATVAVVGDSLNTYYPTNLAIPFLPAGSNVLAIEVHKFSPAQPDLSFDLELFGFGEIEPTLAASLEGDSFVLRWPTNNASYILVSGTDLSRTDDWQPISGPYPVNSGFYEYQEPVNQLTPSNFFALSYVGLSATDPILRRDPTSNAVGLSWPTEFPGFNFETIDLPPTDTAQTVGAPYVSSKSTVGASVPKSTDPAASAN